MSMHRRLDPSLRHLRRETNVCGWPYHLVSMCICLVTRCCHAHFPAPWASRRCCPHGRVEYGVFALNSTHISQVRQNARFGSTSEQWGSAAISWRLSTGVLRFVLPPAADTEAEIEAVSEPAEEWRVDVEGLVRADLRVELDVGQKMSRARRRKAGRTLLSVGCHWLGKLASWS
jgi:hypothetical protein